MLSSRCGAVSVAHLSNFRNHLRRSGSRRFVISAIVFHTAGIRLLLAMIRITSRSSDVGFDCIHQRRRFFYWQRSRKIQVIDRVTELLQIRTEERAKFVPLRAVHHFYDLFTRFLLDCLNQRWLSAQPRGNVEQSLLCAERLVVQAEEQGRSVGVAFPLDQRIVNLQNDISLDVALGIVPDCATLYASAVTRKILRAPSSNCAAVNADKSVSRQRLASSYNLPRAALQRSSDVFKIFDIFNVAPMKGTITSHVIGTPTYTYPLITSK